MKIYENLDLNDLENEIWKDILDYKGDYQVSSVGRIKSFKRYKYGKILKQNKRGDYFQIDLCKNGECKHKYIHILVFETHNSYKLNSGECVHHKDENTENNKYDNLETKPKSKHMSDHHIGKHHSEKTRNKISKNHIGMIGKHHSEKTKNKMSEKKKGKPLSEEHRKKLSESKRKNDLNHKLVGGLSDRSRN
jgi:hypothetical protein